VVIRLPAATPINATCENSRVVHVDEPIVQYERVNPEKPLPIQLNAYRRAANHEPLNAIAWTPIVQPIEANRAGRNGFRKVAPAEIQVLNIISKDIINYNN
tara:strand:- start:323 stop:625 length:303 start_codon:yes stop_codon:yes gene_type:complete